MIKKVVTPSADTITAGQIGKICDLVSSRLRKSSLASEPTQTILEMQGNELADDVVAAIHKRVEAVSNMIVRRVSVNRNRPPRPALEATGRNLYLDDAVVQAMPQGDGKETEEFFFHLGRYVSDAELDQEYYLRGLKPADPYSQAAVNEADSAFADEHPNGTHWRDAEGRWCFCAFYRWDGRRRVHVSRGDYDWRDRWWFAGLRK